MISSLKKFLSSFDNGVYYIGHASALARIDSRLYMFDPIWSHKPYGNYWFFAPEQINCSEVLESLSGCFISHIHEDHVCLPILEKLQCPIHIMANRPNLEKRLEHCKEVRKHPPFSWTRSGLKDAIDFYFVPHAFNSVDSSVFVQSPDSGFTVYHGNDNFLIREVLENIKPDIGRVDIAMVPYAFIHWYPALMKNMTLSERDVEAKRLALQSLKQAEMFCDFMKPRHVIPFGASLFYNDGMDHPLNKNLLTPFDFTRAHPMVAGDFIKESGERSQLVNREQYLDMLQVESIRAQFDRTIHAANVYIGESHLKDLAQRVSRASVEQRVKNHEIIVNDIVIDIEKLTVRRGPFGVKPYHHFEFELYEFFQWANGKITFEQAIGTRRFMCTRVPNEYNPRVFDFMNNFL